jgi:lipid-A-disaccharide synthase-like uncharacterized protein
MFFKAVLFAVFIAAAPGHAAGDPLEGVGRPAAGVVTTGEGARLKVELAGARNSVEIVRLADGSLAYRVQSGGAGTDRLLTPGEFAELYFSQRQARGWLETVFNITGPAGIAWVALGLGGQLLFTGRMLVQWISSERSRRSVVPVSFWWMSLIGATMLLAYFIWRRDIVGVLGQATGWIIYIRNLVLIRRSRG